MLPTLTPCPLQFQSGEYLTLDHSIDTLTARMAELDDEEAEDEDGERPPMQRRGTLGILAERHGFDASFTAYDPDEYLEVEAGEGAAPGLRYSARSAPFCSREG